MKFLALLILVSCASQPGQYDNEFEDSDLDSLAKDLTGNQSKAQIKTRSKK